MWQLIDEAGLPQAGPLTASFERLAAVTEAAAAGPSLHLWRHKQGLALGLQDSRLPALAQAEAHFAQQGWAVAVRPCGGRLVPLTPAVLNLALSYPHGGEPIEAGFERLWGLLARALARLGVAAEGGEVAGSFCPGRYDLSVAGRKVAGLAQRRGRLLTRVEAFLVWADDGGRLAQVAADFYRRAGGPVAIDPKVMGSLAEVCPRPPSLHEVVAALTESLRQ